MNFHKGERTGGKGSDPEAQWDYYLHDKEEDRDGRAGRGDSAAGAFDYAAHDKGAKTSHRVGEILLLNLATRDPKLAKHEMRATIEAAPELKRRAGLAPTGQECEEPMYSFSLNWHPDDNPDTAHMMATARETLRVLGLQDHQAGVIEHTDKPHKHVHVIVNLVHPGTGRVASLWKDEQKLDYWCYRYEIRAGVIRSPGRAAKYEGRDGPAPQHETYDRYMAGKRERDRARAAAANDNRAREAARRVHAAWRPNEARVRELQDASFQRRRDEAEAMWQQNRDEQARIRAACNDRTAAIWKRAAGPRAWPLTAQVFRDWTETLEHQALTWRQKQGLKLFQVFERSAGGRFVNAARLLPDAVAEGTSRWRAAFALATQGEERRRLYEARLAAARAQLFARHGLTRRLLAEQARRERDAELRQLAESYRARLAAMKVRHQYEIENGKAKWRGLNEDRRQAVEAARDEVLHQPVPVIEEPQEIPAHVIDPEVAAAVERAMQEPRAPREPSPHRETGGWTKRRSAAERREDGTYKPRNRGHER